MKIQKQKCDLCGKETADRYSEIGWIEIKTAEISISMGRDKHSSSYSAFSKSIGLDFCDEYCLVEYLRKMKNKADGNHPC